MTIAACEATAAGEEAAREGRFRRAPRRLLPRRGEGGDFTEEDDKGAGRNSSALGGFQMWSAHLAVSAQRTFSPSSLHFPASSSHRSEMVAVASQTFAMPWLHTSSTDPHWALQALLDPTGLGNLGRPPARSTGCACVCAMWCWVPMCRQGSLQQMFCGGSAAALRVPNWFHQSSPQAVLSSSCLQAIKNLAWCVQLLRPSCRPWAAAGRTAAAALASQLRSSAPATASAATCSPRNQKAAPATLGVQCRQQRGTWCRQQH